MRITMLIQQQTARQALCKNGLILWYGIHYDIEKSKGADRLVNTPPEDQKSQRLKQDTEKVYCRLSENLIAQKLTT